MEPTYHPIEIYRFRVVLRDASPHIWRRVLVRSDSSLVDLHQTIQIALGWNGRQAFAFEVQGHRRSIHLEGPAQAMRLADLRLYVKERFTYTYNTPECASRPWEFAIRLEHTLAMEVRQHYPRCIGGVGAPPPEHCGGPIASESLRDLFTPGYVAWWTEEQRAEGWTLEHDEELHHLQLWIDRTLDRRAINRQLRQVGDHPRKEDLQP
jgi:hypothetical protein